ncbi:hypothetical protein Acr_00g0057740 [Actinidia rufa]|uniref:Uncharacterized protein n=1 Tax=Actinidia rufa TaxID=165716 RepID=A0A7J0DMM0_9ERIC|nr:hypothetical protein Acr_00g0057740 [Actinidia rufa]
MLVRDSEALAQFRVDHRIPDDVVIKRPGPNDDADWVEGEGNRMPIRTWFIYQAGLRFPLSKLLRTVLSICRLTFMQISVKFCPNRVSGGGFDAERRIKEFPADEPDPFSVPKHRGYVLVGFNRRFWRRSDRCSAAISAVNNCGRSRKVSDLLGYVPLYQYTIPLRAARQGRPILPPLQCCERRKAHKGARSPRLASGEAHSSAAPRLAPRCAPFCAFDNTAPLQIRRPGSRPRSSLFDEVSDLFEGTSAELRRLLEEAEGESSGSSESSSSSWDVNLGDEGLNEEVEVEDGEEVDQVPAAVPLVPAPLVPIPEPINLPSSDSDIAIVESREIVEHSYSHSGNSSSGSRENEEIMAPKVRILGKGQAPRTEPPMLPEAPDSAMAVPAEDQSIAPSSMAGGKRKGKQPAEGTSRQKRGKGAGSATGTPELWAPQFAAVEVGKQVTSADTSKDHETCVALGNAVMLPQDVADHAAETTAEFGGKLVMLGAQTKSELADARSAAKIAILQRNQAQQEASELKAFACGEVYKKLFDRAFKRAGDLYERQLAELRPGVFQEGWLTCLKELKTPPDHSAWSSPAPPVQLPASLERYSPINLPDFNEEEYATLPADEGNIITAVAEARTEVEETVDRDRAGEAEGDRAVEADGENLV